MACFEKNLDTLDRPCCFRHAASHYLSGFQLPLNITTRIRPGFAEGFSVIFPLVQGDSIGTVCECFERVFNGRLTSKHIVPEINLQVCAPQFRLSVYSPIRTYNPMINLETYSKMISHLLTSNICN